jgi:hypothetical protein
MQNLDWKGMRLQDARKLAIRRRARIRFSLSSGMECVIDEHGISRVPGLASAPDFNLEEEFARAARFTLEPAAGASGRPELLARDQLEALAAAPSGSAAEAEE